MSDTLWPLEPSTEAKHRLYRRYLDGWWPVMLQQSHATGYLRERVTYVDAFAGPGRYECGEEGSPLFALDGLLNHDAVERMHLSRERVRLVFIEKRRDRCEHLVDELTSKFGDLEKLPVHVEVRRDDATSGTITALDDLGGWGHAVLAIFDSWGNVNVPHSLMRRIAGNPASEAIVTFGPNWFSRRADLDADQLDAVFGGRVYWQQADRETSPDERWRAWLASYRSALNEAGFEYRLQFEVVPKTGQPLYLVYGTTHPKGVEVMKDAMWRVDGEGGMSFRDPRTRGAQVSGQLDLFGSGGLTNPELRELVVQRLNEDATTVQQLREWLKRETARWRAKDAPRAVKELRDDGVVATDPPGRITKATVVKLR